MVTAIASSVRIVCGSTSSFAPIKVAFNHRAKQRPALASSDCGCLHWYGVKMSLRFGDGSRLWALVFNHRVKRGNAIVANPLTGRPEFALAYTV